MSETGQRHHDARHARRQEKVGDVLRVARLGINILHQQDGREVGDPGTDGNRQKQAPLPGGAEPVRAVLELVHQVQNARQPGPHVLPDVRVQGRRLRQLRQGE